VDDNAKHRPTQTEGSVIDVAVGVLGIGVHVVGSQDGESDIGLTTR